MPVSIPSAVEVVSSISTGSDLPVEHPETMILHMLGSHRLEQMRRRLEIMNAGAAQWSVYEALNEEMISCYPMVLEPCSDDLAARRCEWYAKVLRAALG